MKIKHKNKLHPFGFFPHLDDDFDAEGGDGEEPRADGEGAPQVRHQRHGRRHQEQADGQRAQVAPAAVGAGRAGLGPEFTETSWDTLLLQKNP